MNLSEIDFTEASNDCASGWMDSGEIVPGGRLRFPAFAAGAEGTARGVAKFLAAS